MALVILDRDGVINEDSDDYIRSLADWHPVPGSIAAIARLCQAGYRVAIATNQSGLSRGYFTLDTLEAIHSELCSQVEAAGGQIDGIFYCPHLPDEGCACRKPNIGLIEAIANELQLDATGATFVGDSLKDLQAAQRAGCQPVLVRTGKGRGTEQQLQAADVALRTPQAVPVFDNLAQAVDQLLAPSPA